LQVLLQAVGKGVGGVDPAVGPCIPAAGKEPVYALAEMEYTVIEEA
jgi:hypothetical protein